MRQIPGIILEQKVLVFNFLFYMMKRLEPSVGNGCTLWLQPKVSTDIYWTPVQRSTGTSDGKDKAQALKN